MRLAVLQPAGSDVARSHYTRTIEQPVLLKDYTGLMGRDYSVLRDLHPSGEAIMWGATPGKNNNNVAAALRMSAGDFVFFAGSGRLFSGGTVTHTFRNPALAQALWGRDQKHQTWELMFALDELRSFDIPYAEMNRTIGYASNNIVQGFTVLDAKRSAALFDYLDLDSDLHPAAPTPADLAARLAELASGTERQVDTLRRLEQGLLRRTLLPGTTGTCALCGDVLPVQFLVAAHIKKRSVCTEAERLDIPAIAMAACKFGCDALFEAGYVGVDSDGTVRVSPLAPATGAAGQYLSRVAGARCDAYGEARADYFDWHLRHTFRRSTQGP